MIRKLNEECGIVGVYNLEKDNASEIMYYSLMTLQHRGQESAGMVVRDNGNMLIYKQQGLVQNVFEPHILSYLKGTCGIGHVRYSTCGESTPENAQPVLRKYREGKIALVHNGNIRNAKEIRHALERNGQVFTTDTDSEVVLALIISNRLITGSIEEAVEKSMQVLKGGYSCILMTKQKIVAFKDPFGFRPLSFGKIGNGYIFASESCVMEVLNAKYERYLKPGEIIVISRKGFESIETTKSKGRFCSFEYIYFSRPDSFMNGLNVSKARLNLGRQLFKEHKLMADVVIGVPDSGNTAALGYSYESGIPYNKGFVRNPYVGRTFIKPFQEERALSVEMKLSPLTEMIKRKDVIMVDDSIVRGTTIKNLIKYLKDAGAKKVFAMISSPPVKYSCFYGIDTPKTEELLASNHSVDEIKNITGADGLYYLSIEGLLEALKESKLGHCIACFDGNYPI